MTVLAFSVPVALAMVIIVLPCFVVTIRVAVTML